jgi:hypothetical protein
VVSLALGIGANVALFSVVRALLALLSVAADGLSSAMDRLSSEITLGIVSTGLPSRQETPMASHERRQRWRE